MAVCMDGGVLRILWRRGLLEGVGGGNWASTDGWKLAEDKEKRKTLFLKKDRIYIMCAYFGQRCVTLKGFGMKGWRFG